MPQIGGKPVKKSSKTKSSSTSKRHFTIVIGTKEHGLYVSSSPSSAARKAVSKLCGKNVKNVEFCLREITQGSKKKTYGPYLGHVEILAKPIQLKGRLVERMPVARLKPKNSAKKGGMRGGEIEDEFITEFETAILNKPSRNNKDNKTSTGKLTINDLSKKYLERGLTADRQKDILTAQFKTKVSEVDFGNTNKLQLLRAKYKRMGVSDINDMEVVPLIKKRLNQERSS